MLNIIQGVRDTKTVTISSPPQYVYRLVITQPLFVFHLYTIKIA